MCAIKRPYKAVGASAKCSRGDSGGPLVFAGFLRNFFLSLKVPVHPGGNMRIAALNCKWVRLIRTLGELAS